MTQLLNLPSGACAQTKELTFCITHMTLLSQFSNLLGHNFQDHNLNYASCKAEHGFCSIRHPPNVHAIRTRVQQVIISTLENKLQLYSQPTLQRIHIATECAKL